MLKCKVCGCEFPALAEKRYTSRDNGKVGALSVIASEMETIWYDSFDCPQCGCQHIAKERKRTILIPSDDGDDE